jgi:Ni/Co efflux regulator RcnB
VNRIVHAVTASVFAAALSVGASAQNHQDNDHHDNGGPPQHNGGPPQQHNNGQPQHNGGPPQHYDNNHYVHHTDWHKGARMAPNDWNRGDRIDYRQYHLAPPRQGYEWRRVDGNYVMAAVATGLVASLIVASTVH